MIDYSKIFYSSKIQEKFEKDGFAIIRFKDYFVLEQLERIHQEFFTSEISGLYASHNINSYETNQTISLSIENAIQSLFKHHFNAVQFILGHYMIKAHSVGDEFQLHQDWSVTDEQIFFSAHLWIPLQDTNYNNGTMFVIPGSHLYFNNYRSGSLNIPRIKRDKLIDKMIVPVPVKKGEMLIYHPALFHGSYANQSKKNRVAVLVSLLQKDCLLKYFHKDDKKTGLDVYDITAKSILSDLKNLESGNAPTALTVSETINCHQKANELITSKDLYTIFKTKESYHYNLKKKSIFQKIISFIKD